MKKFFIMALLAISVAAQAQQVFDVNLWPGKAPHNTGDPNDTAKVRIFLPEKSEATGRAVVICPGGGYSHLAMEHEGYQWGAFFNNMGIAAIVLKYRIKSSDGLQHSSTDTGNQTLF